jgi:ABC-type phosphate/phosphonate transport system substrate-binding protein
MSTVRMRTRTIAATVAGRFITGLAALGLAGVLQAADNAVSKRVSFVPPTNAATAPAQQSGELPTQAVEPLVFSAPPRESNDEAAKLYEPIAQYFARVLGRRVEYRHPKSWLSYQGDAIKGAYDIVFDEAHFNSWAIARINHTALAKLSDETVFAVVARKENTQLTGVKQLAGKTVCTIGASSLGTLSLLSEFDPLRQPLVIEGANWAKVYEGVMDGRCIAATMPVAILQKLDGAGATRTIHRSRPLPNHVFSASPRLTKDEQAKLSQALVSAEGGHVLAALLAANGAQRGLALATKEDYTGMDTYLKDVWGYGR